MTRPQANGKENGPGCTWELEQRSESGRGEVEVEL